MLFLVEAGQAVSIHSRLVVESYPSFHLSCIDLADEDTKIDVVVAWNKHLDNPSVTLFLKRLGVLL
jgi:DNA-binding transcriptional LysR family regulator